MIEYNKVNVKLSNLKLSKLNTAVKNNEGTTLRISSKMFNSNDLPHELFLTQRQITKLRNNIENNMSSDMKLSKAQKIIMSGGNCSKFAGPLMKISRPLVTKVLPNLGLTAAMSGIDGAIKKKRHGSGSGTTTLIISNDEMDDIIKIVQALENQGVLVGGVTKSIKNDIKNLSENGIGMLLGMLGSSLLSDVFNKSLSGHGITRSGHGIARSGYGNKQEI